MVLESYATALKQKQPVKEIEKYKTAIKDFLSDVKLGKFVPFNLVLVSKDEAKKIYAEIPVYKPAEDLIAAVNSIDEQFAMYAQDLKNSKAAVAVAEGKVEQVKKDTEELIEIESATNTLVSSAGSLDVTSSAAKIKKTKQVVEENTDAWAMTVLAEFVKNFAAARKTLRISTWSKLSIGQMTAALGKLATEDNDKKFSNLVLKTIEK
jgi:uncharacterized protein YaaR (DUF327 family)